jgi:hypothetical protein
MRSVDNIFLYFHSILLNKSVVFHIHSFSIIYINFIENLFSIFSNVAWGTLCSFTPPCLFSTTTENEILTYLKSNQNELDNQKILLEAFENFITDVIKSEQASLTTRIKDLSQMWEMASRQLLWPSGF